MHTYMHMFMCMCMCMYMCMCMCVHMYVHVGPEHSPNMHMHMHMCMYTHAHVHVHTCTCACTCYMCTCYMCTCACRTSTPPRHRLGTLDTLDTSGLNGCGKIYVTWWEPRGLSELRLRVQVNPPADAWTQLTSMSVGRRGARSPPQRWVASSIYVFGGYGAGGGGLELLTPWRSTIRTDRRMAYV